MVPKLTGSGGVSSFNGRFRIVFEILAVDLPFGQRDHGQVLYYELFRGGAKPKPKGKDKAGSSSDPIEVQEQGA